MVGRWLRVAVWWATAATAAWGGCAEPGPTYFPVAPLAEERLADGRVSRLYDLSGDGSADYSEVLSAEGRVALLRYDVNGDGTFEEEVARRTAGAAARDNRHLVLILDSVPFAMVDVMWRQGRFRLFAPPSRVISPFPVMTDLSLAEFFGTSPSPAVESMYYDGHALQGGYLNYAAEGNAGWNANTSYHLIHFIHSVAYLQPRTWFEHELGKIQRFFYATDDNPFVGYVVTTSGLGAHFGRDGHQPALVKLDRFCQSVMHAMRGRVEITLMSDHGHNLVPSRRIPLSELLGAMGYRVADRLEGPQDVVVPEFGVVTCAAVYTRSAASVARDLAGVDGIDLTMHREGEAVMVRSRRGVARVWRGTGGYGYACEEGDPLELRAILDGLRADGAERADGTFDDRVLFEATKGHRYPDALQRVWRPFDGLMTYTPDVLVSVEDGWHAGSALQTELVDISSTHGSLNAASSLGFVMSTAGSVPEYVRMEDLRRELRALGVPFEVAEPERAAPGTPRSMAEPMKSSGSNQPGV